MRSRLPVLSIIGDKLQVRHIDDLAPAAEAEILTSFCLWFQWNSETLDCSMSCISTSLRRPPGSGIQDTHTYTGPIVFFEYLSTKNVWAILQVASASAYLITFCTAVLAVSSTYNYYSLCSNLIRPYEKRAAIVAIMRREARTAA